MTETQANSAIRLEAIVVEPETPVQGCVIWLHGLGADGQDLLPLSSALALPKQHGLRFVFPHAPWRPVTINAKQTMRAWYDILSLEKLTIEDVPGIQEACLAVQALATQQDLPSERIVLAGFSQGGAIALAAGLSGPLPYAGIIALSTYLPLTKRTSIALNSSTTSLNIPILQCHGTQDNVIPLHVGKETAAYLHKHYPQTQWKEYEMGHTISEKTRVDIRDWLQTHLL